MCVQERGKEGLRADVEHTDEMVVMIANHSHVARAIDSYVSCQILDPVIIRVTANRDCPQNAASTVNLRNKDVIRASRHDSVATDIQDAAKCARGKYITIWIHRDANALDRAKCSLAAASIDECIATKINVVAPLLDFAIRWIAGQVVAHDDGPIVTASS